jgi:hypothetical protein
MTCDMWRIRCVNCGHGHGIDEPCMPVWFRWWR